jgi:hypothetical protein
VDGILHPERTLIMDARLQNFDHVPTGGASGKEVEGAILAVCRQLKGRRVLDLGEDDSEMLTLLGSLSILAKCKAGESFPRPVHSSSCL